MKHKIPKRLLLLKVQVDNAINCYESGLMRTMKNRQDFTPNNVSYLGDFIIIDNSPYRDTNDQ